MLAVGFLLFLLALGTTLNSAIQEIAVATIWTGWNVLWGVGSLRQNARITYVVYRDGH
jgi:hypothetical protein